MSILTSPHWQWIKERRAKVVNLRVAGLTWAAISRELCISKNAARRIGRVAYEKGEMSYEQMIGPKDRQVRASTEAEYAAKFVERVLRSIKVDLNGCWIWQKTLSSKGYGLTQYHGRPITVHRKLFEVLNGLNLTTTDYVCHRCDVRACANVAHMFLGDAMANAEDMLSKGRHAEQKVTHCPRGHAYDKENTYITPSGSRACKMCTAKRSRARQELRKSA